MLSEADFSTDTEFLKLLARQEDVDLTVAALELARDAHPQLRFQPTLDWIAARGAELRPICNAAIDDTSVLTALADCLARRYGLTGSREAYSFADSSYLPRVIELQRGIPISLSVLYMAVANSAGVELHGIAAPGHFLTRYDGLEESWFLDPFSQGKSLSWDETLFRVQNSSGLTEGQVRKALEPASTRTITIRMLNNLKALYVQQGNWQQGWRVQRRLAALLPADYQERRDLGLISVKAGQIALAVNLLEQCASDGPAEDQELLTQQLGEAKRMLSRWN